MELVSTGAWEITPCKLKILARRPAFSRRPAILGRYIASSLLEDYRAAVEITEKSLLPNPNDPILLNNLAFAYASLGQLDDAQGALDKADKTKASPSDLVCLTATQGMVYYRKGQVQGTRSLPSGTPSGRKRPASLAIC